MHVVIYLLYIYMHIYIIHNTNGKPYINMFKPTFNNLSQQIFQPELPASWKSVKYYNMCTKSKYLKKPYVENISEQNFYPYQIIKK